MAPRLKVVRSTDSVGRTGWRWTCHAHPKPRTGFHRDWTWIDYSRKRHGMKPRQPAQARAMDAGRAHLTLRHPED